MKVHGKIVRVPTSEPGLLMIGGQQFRFSMPDAWKCEVRPKPGLDVCVELDTKQQVVAIWDISETGAWPATSRNSCSRFQRLKKMFIEILPKLWTSNGL